MSEMPWVRFFPSDWLAGTRGMSAVETGIYITLVATMYERGEPVPEDHKRLARLCGASNSAFKAALDTLIAEGKITRVDGGLWNNRVGRESEMRSEKSEVGRQSAKARWGTKDSKNNANGDANASETQSERNANQKPEPEPEENNPPPVNGAGRARDLFDETWTVFPQNPQSNRAEARKAFEAKPVKVQLRILDAAQRYRTWFEAEQKGRGRDYDEALRYAPPLGKWLESGGWEQVAELKVKGEPDPDLAFVSRDSPEFKALERHRGKPIFVGDSGKVTVKRSELDAAMKEAVH